MNKHPKQQPKQKKSKGFALSVSRKFYDEIMARVDTSLSALRTYHLIIMEVKRYLCEYLINGREPQMRLPELELQLTVSLLKPEIEKAIARSARARERRRKEKKDAEKQPATSAFAEIPPVTIRRTPQMMAFGVPRMPIRTTVIDLDAPTQPPVASIADPQGFSIYAPLGWPLDAPVTTSPRSLGQPEGNSGLKSLSEPSAVFEDSISTESEDDCSSEFEDGHSADTTDKPEEKAAAPGLNRHRRRSNRRQWRRMEQARRRAARKVAKMRANTR